MAVPNHPEIRAAILQAAPDWTPGQVGRYAQEIVAAARTLSFRKRLGAASEQEAINAVLEEFTRDPPSPTTFPAKWLDGLVSAPASSRIRRMKSVARAVIEEGDELE